MNFRKFFIYNIFVLVTAPLYSQSLQKVDTMHTDEDLTHMFLNIEIPSGEMVLQSSGICGSSVSKLFATDAFVKHHVQSNSDQEGNHFRTISVQSPKPGEGNAPAAAANMRFSEQFTNIETYAEKSSYISEFHPDPSMSTDLFVDLGVGASNLDLSGLSLNNVSINSAFSNVVVTYSAPNQGKMKKMDIHAASADIELNNLEYAGAELITIQNDMGETQLVLGNGQTPESTIYLQSGVGSCKLIIDKDQPIKLTLKSGFFSTVNVDDSFEKVQKGVYTNAAFKANKGKCIKIICNIDFGSISVVETE